MMLMALGMYSESSMTISQKSFSEVTIDEEPGGTRAHCASCFGAPTNLVECDSVLFENVLYEGLECSGRALSTVVDVVVDRFSLEVDVHSRRCIWVRRTSIATTIRIIRFARIIRLFEVDDYDC